MASRRDQVLVPFASGKDGDVGRSIGAVLSVIYGRGLQEVGSSRNSARNALRETTYRCALSAALRGCLKKA
jgi:hypothetical protein